MDFYTRNRKGNWVLIILVILNLVLLATIWYPRLKPGEKEIQRKQKKQYDDQKFRQDEENRKQRDKRLTGFLKRELNFTQDQIDKFLQLRDEHFQKTKQVRRQVDDLRREMMDQLLVDQPDSSQVEKLTEKMGQKTAELEKAVFYHFIELMGVCDSEQKSKYKSLLREILNQLKPPDHRPPPGDHPQEPTRRPADEIHPPPPRQEERQTGTRDREIHLPSQDRGEPPLPRDDTGGQNHAERFFNRLRHQLQLTDSQVKKIQPLVESAHQKLEKIPYDPQYSSNEERRQAMNQVNQWLDSQIEALLTEQQKIQYTEIKKERNRHQPPRPPY
jgi:Spy/CpxP family protein refolding chaperone